MLLPETRRFVTFARAAFRPSSDRFPSIASRRVAMASSSGVVAAAAPFAQHWLVMDMDGTITPTPSSAGGHYLPLSESPCGGPLAAFVARGGSVCVVSTAGRRMWRQVFDVLAPTLFPRCKGAAAAAAAAASDGSSSAASENVAVPPPGMLVICGFSGAAFFRSDAAQQLLVEDIRYREIALAPHPSGSSDGAPPTTVTTSGGGSTCVPVAAVPDIQAALVAVLRRVFALATDDPTYISQLSQKYHGPYTALVAMRREDPQRFEAEVLTVESLGQHGKYLTATGDALLDAQWVPGTTPPVIVQFSVLGVPMARFDEVFTPAVRAELEGLGVYCKKQPNSVVVAPQGVDKATCVSWLLAHEPTFALDRAIAFGDVPASIDRPLTLFPPMPFVSVSPVPEQDPPGVCHVGAEERGTAEFLKLLLAQADTLATPDFSHAAVSAMAQAARDDVRLGKAKV